MESVYIAWCSTVTSVCVFVSRCLSTGDAVSGAARGWQQLILNNLLQSAAGVILPTWQWQAYRYNL